MHPEQLHRLATMQHRAATDAAEPHRTRRAARDRARRDTRATRARRRGVGRRGPEQRTARSPSAFRRLWLSAGASNLADGVLFAGLPVLATQVTDSPGLIAGVAVALMLPMAVSALPAGVVADRLDRRQVLVVGNVVRVVGLGAVLAAVLAGELGLAAIYAVAAIAGGSEILVDTTAQTAVVELVERDDLARANAKLGGTQVVMNDAIGAPIGSFLAGMGAGAAFGVPVLLFALAAVVLRRSPMTTPVRAARTDPLLTGLRLDVVEGMRHLTGQPVLRRLALANAVSNLGNTAFFAVFVVFVIGPLALPAATYGWFLAAVALGGLAGSIAANRIIGALGHATTIRIVAIGVVGIYGLASLTSSPAVMAGAVGMLGGASMIWNVTSRVLRQTLVPGALLGRVTATMALVALAAAPLGGIIGGLVAELAGIRAVGAVTVTTSLLAAALLLPVTTGAITEARAHATGAGSGAPHRPKVVAELDSGAVRRG
jgi:predicted MFS family arabinose efflux permease